MSLPTPSTFPLIAKPGPSVSVFTPLSNSMAVPFVPVMAPELKMLILGVLLAKMPTWAVITPVLPLLITPWKVGTSDKKIPASFPDSLPLLVMPPENAVVSLTWMALKLVAVTVPLLVMPPAKLDMPSTAIPSWVALIAPPLVTPPEKVGTPISMPNPPEMVPVLLTGPEKLPRRLIPPSPAPALIVPVFVIPPVTVTLSVEMPVCSAVIEPLLMMAPLIVLFPTPIPVPLGPPGPGALIVPVPVFVTFPATVAWLINMQFRSMNAAQCYCAASTSLVRDRARRRFAAGCALNRGFPPRRHTSMDGNAPAKIRFDTAVLPERDRFPMFCEEVVRRCTGLDLRTPDQRGFNAALELRRVGAIDIGRIAASCGQPRSRMPAAASRQIQE